MHGGHVVRVCVEKSMKRTPFKKHRVDRGDRDDPVYRALVASMGCIVCRNLGYGYVECCVHHPRLGQGMAQRAPDSEAFGLCPRHHKHHGLGVSLHDGQATWEAKYGTEAQLTAQTQREAAEVAQARRECRPPRL